MRIERTALPLLCLALAGCGDSGGTFPFLLPTTITASGGSGQSASAGSALPAPLSVLVADDTDRPVPDVTVAWSVIDGGGSITPTSVTNSGGIASANFTLGPTVGEQHARAEVTGLSGSPVVFTATATATPGLDIELHVAAGGNNVPDRLTSDLWVHGSYAYTGTWGSLRQGIGNQLKVWALDPSGAPTQVGSVTLPNIGTVSDVQVSEDGQVLVVSGERGRGAGGIYLYGLGDPAHPALLGAAETGDPGVHTVTLADINGRRYAFAARNAGLSAAPEEDPALLIYDVTDPSAPAAVARRPFPRNIGLHDTYVRDGIAFAFAWNTGVVIYDVGNGARGGSPSAPVEISRLITAGNGICCGASVHNGWWFHNPVTGEKRYLFIGQEGRQILGQEASGDIHVVDVSDLAHPTEVAFFHLNGAGTHNFWMDEARQILYAAYYNAGVIALDVSGTLAGDLSSRLLSELKPGGDGKTFTWGVQLANGFLYASDMYTGLWQLATE